MREGRAPRRPRRLSAAGPARIRASPLPTRGGRLRAGMASKVLIVDDEPDLELLLRQRFRRELRDGTYEFLFARNGEEALALVGADPDVEVVLSDINMPVMDGLTLL